VVAHDDLGELRLAFAGVGGQALAQRGLGGLRWLGHGLYRARPAVTVAGDHWFGMLPRTPRDFRRGDCLACQSLCRHAWMLASALRWHRWPAVQRRRIALVMRARIVLAAADGLPNAVFAVPRGGLGCPPRASRVPG
jgi:hypothetical protein